MKVIVIGNGVAGVQVAKELRAREPDAGKLSILILARERHHYYSRIRLPEAFDPAGPSAEALALYKPSWYAERSIEVRLDANVAAIDRAARTVSLDTGAQVPYDALVIATGSSPARPELPGVYLPGVSAVREFDDALTVRASVAAKPAAAVVIGGGLLGLEAARHLELSGVGKVTVLEAAPRLLPRQLDAEGGAVLAAALAGLGIETRVAMKVAGFEGKSRVESVALEGGEDIPAGTAIISMGVRPRLGLAQAAGLRTARGIVVDDYLRTSEPSIYALGDCAEYRGAVWGIIPAAMDEAPCCAAAVLGDASRPYSGTLPANSLKVAGVELASFGAAAEPPEGAEVFGGGAGEGRYEKYVLFEGKLAGAIVMGSKEKARKVQALMGKAMGRAEAESLMLGA
jgi:nitrite reductase (NADH) large subunit